MPKVSPWSPCSAPKHWLSSQHVQLDSRTPQAKGTRNSSHLWKPNRTRATEMVAGWRFSLATSVSWGAPDKWHARIHIEPGEPDAPVEFPAWRRLDHHRYVDHALCEVASPAANRSPASGKHATAPPRRRTHRPCRAWGPGPVIVWYHLAGHSPRAVADRHSRARHQDPAQLPGHDQQAPPSAHARHIVRTQGGLVRRRRVSAKHDITKIGGRIELLNEFTRL